MLKMGKSFDRNYNLRVPFLDGFYNIGIFLNKKSSFLLFSASPDFSSGKVHIKSIKINMFKNLTSSKFCETFLDLHNFRKNTLDIVNQFDKIKSDYYQDVNFKFNELITLSKVEVSDRTFYDTVTLYGFTLSSYIDEFLFIIAERQSIIKRLNRKVVRTTGLQISTTPAISLLDEFHNESLVAGKAGLEQRFPSNEVIVLSEEESKNKKEEENGNNN
jgi:hypothetical protein